MIVDAVYTLRNLHENRRPFRVPDTTGYQRSTDEIRAFEEAQPDALLIPTPDQDVWERAYGGSPREVPRPVA